MEKHGYKGTVIYRRWQNMKHRCYYAGDKDYHNYGGRGIKVCDRWRNSFQNFLDDIGPIPSPEYTLDRLDTNGDYGPDNCRWATRSEQIFNRRITIKLTLNGKTRTLKQWALHLNINYCTLWERVKQGQSAEIALRGPTGRNARLKWLTEHWKGKHE